MDLGQRPVAQTLDIHLGKDTAFAQEGDWQWLSRFQVLQDCIQVQSKLTSQFTLNWVIVQPLGGDAGQTCSMKIVVARELEARCIAGTAIENEPGHAVLDSAAHRVLVYADHDEIVLAAPCGNELVEPLDSGVDLGVKAQRAAAQMHLEAGVARAGVQQAVQVGLVQRIFVNKGQEAHESR